MNRFVRLVPLLALLLGACATKMLDKEYSAPAGMPLARLVFLSLDRGSYSVEFLEEKKWKQMKRHVSARRGGSGFFNELSEADTEIIAGQPVVMRLHFSAPASDGRPALKCDPEIRLCVVPDEKYELQLDTEEDRCELILSKQYVTGGGILRREPVDLKDIAECPEAPPEEKS